jgi:predicted transcriptional regulator
MKKLTQAEEQVMQVIWTLPEGGYLKDIIEILPEPKPHSNTVATLLKILVEGGLFWPTDGGSRRIIFRGLLYQCRFFPCG